MDRTQWKRRGPGIFLLQLRFGRFPLFPLSLLFLTCALAFSPKWRIRGKRGGATSRVRWYIRASLRTHVDAPTKPPSKKREEEKRLGLDKHRLPEMRLYSKSNILYALMIRHGILSHTLIISFCTPQLKPFCFPNTWEGKNV